jgi:class 3 adenylate cyclase
VPYAAAMPTVEEYEQAGLYDPAGDATNGRLGLLGWLDEQGFTIPEMQHAFATDALVALPGDRRMVPGERRSRAEAIERSGLSPEDLDAFSTAFGFVPIRGAPEGEVGYTDDEIRALASVSLLSTMFSPDEAMSLIRVIGSSLARIGEAGVSLFLADIESPHVLSGASELDLAHAVYDAVGLLDGLTERLDPILRRQMLQAVERTRRTAIDLTERFQYRYAIGFVDLVGFTALSSHMGARELSIFMGRFEAESHDIATSAGARVVKLIGDEVMFAATDPVAACDAAVALMRAFDGEYIGVTPRGGLAYGNVVLRSGDYYGSVVNLASRLVDEAVPLELLVTKELADAAPARAFEPAGRRMVKGFDDPVAVCSINADTTPPV